MGGFTLISDIINDEDIIDLKVYVPKSFAIKHMEQKLLEMQR